MAQQKGAEKELHDAAWVWAGRLVLAAGLVGAGVFGGYMKWGDATELRGTVGELQDSIVKLKNARETESTKKARVERDKEVCERELKEMKKKLPK